MWTAIEMQKKILKKNTQMKRKAFYKKNKSRLA